MQRASKRQHIIVDIVVNSSSSYHNHNNNNNNHHHTTTTNNHHISPDLTIPDTPVPKPSPEIRINIVAPRGHRNGDEAAATHVDGHSSGGADASSATAGSKYDYLNENRRSD